MNLPRFTLRFLLIAVTLVAVGLGSRQRLYVIRPVTEQETEAVTPGLAAWQVRWRLGAPHNVDEAWRPEDLNRWSFEYTDRERNRLGEFKVTFNKVTGCVAFAERKSYDVVDP